MTRPLKTILKLTLVLLILAHLAFIILLFSPSKFLLSLSHKNAELVVVENIPEEAQSLLLKGQEQFDTQLNNSEGLGHFFRNAPLRVRQKLFMNEQERLAVNLSLTQFSPELIGMQAGAEYYFQKPLNELSNEEWILLMNLHLMFQN